MRKSVDLPPPKPVFDELPKRPPPEVFPEPKVLFEPNPEVVAVAPKAPKAEEV
jgi:hypothetical protein